MQPFRILAPAAFLVSLALLVVTSDSAVAVSRDGHWSERFMPMGLKHETDDGNAQCLGTWSRYLVVGGWFVKAGAVDAERIAAWDNGRWYGFGGGPNGQVEAIYDAGTQMYIGGNFSQVAGQERHYAARYDGTTYDWYDMGNVGSVVRGFVERFGKVYALGSFINPDEYAPPYTPLAFWQDGAWHYESVYDWHLWDRPYGCAIVDTSFVIGGELSLGSCYGLIRWDGSGSYGYNFDASVLDVEDVVGGAYIGGWFETAGGEASPGLVYMNGTHHLVPVPPPPAEFYAQNLSHHGDTIYCADDYEVRYYLPGYGWSDPLGGTFTDAIFDIHWHGGDVYVAGNMPGGVARWDYDEWVGLGGGLSGSRVNCLVPYDGDLFAGGMFGIPEFTVEQGSSNAIGRWDGDAWQRVSGGVDQEVQALCPFRDDLWVGGTFGRAGELSTRNLAMFDGESWHDVGGAGGPVRCFTVYDGELIAGGGFATIGGVAAPSLAAYDGAAWRPFASALTGTVQALTSFRGDLIVAGAFHAVDGVAAERIVRWDGAQWHAMDEGMNSTVVCLTEWQGDLYAGGYFTSAGGEPAAYIARWDGSQWHDVGGGVGAPAVYGVLTLLGTTTDLFVGGDFTTAGGAPIPALAAWDGAQWSAFGGGLEGDGYAPTVRGLQVVDGDLWVLGRFAKTGGTASCNIARWIDGTLVPTYLNAFDVRVDGAAVVARWSTSSPAAVADFRLEASSGSLTWVVPCATNGVDFTARDTSPQLVACAGREVIYALHHQDEPSHWSRLAERALTMPPPAADLLLTAYPNPFNPRLDVAFTLGHAGSVMVEVYALDGHRVCTVFAGELPAGRHAQTWGGKDARGRSAASGTYILRVATDGAVASRKVMLAR